VAGLGWGLVLPAFWLAAVIGVTMAIIDLRVRRLPFVLSGAVNVVSVVFMGVQAVATQDFVALGRAFVAALGVSVTFLVLALAVPGQLGLGDVILIGWIALTLGWLGWSNLVLGLVAGLLLQFVGAVVWAVRRMPRGNPLPMGPALLVGWLMGVVAVA
jgi:leader peptidase (prepilin peptidase) / N-methyltransferase